MIFFGFSKSLTLATVYDSLGKFPDSCLNLRGDDSTEKAGSGFFKVPYMIDFLYAERSFFFFFATLFYFFVNFQECD